MRGPFAARVRGTRVTFFVKTRTVFVFLGLSFFVFLTASAFPSSYPPAPSAGYGAISLPRQPLYLDAPRAGAPLPGLSAPESALFVAGQQVFVTPFSVQGHPLVANSGRGLGPRFNSDSCVSCHAQPAVGGTSPAHNPLLAIGVAFGARNRIPFFIAPAGPVIEARFKYRVAQDGRLAPVRDGGVHELFTISGRIDAPGCELLQPDFERAAAANNLVFRIPTPVFGLGLVESIPDGSIEASHAATRQLRRPLGITGHPNRSANDGTITRFGWKAQNKSMLVFAGEAFSQEMGVTNEQFNNERADNPACFFNPTPEDFTPLVAPSPAHAQSATNQIAAYMRFLAPPRPLPQGDPTIARGHWWFDRIGCVLCHTQALPVGPSISPAIRGQKWAYLYSDLMVHHMGAALADDIIQGVAGPDEFRSTPLWGLGQRLFFLHDGRTQDLEESILFHESGPARGFPPSESNVVIQQYRQLSAPDKQALLAFLRSL